MFKRKGSSTFDDQNDKRKRLENDDDYWEVHNYSNINEALTFLLQIPEAEENLTSDDVSAFKLIIEGDYRELKLINIGKLNRKFRSKSVLLFFASKDDEQFNIYWKSKEIIYFLVLEPYNEHFSANDKNLCEFTADFLWNTLKNGQLGIRQNLDTKKVANKIELHLLADSRDYNLLLIAAENGNAKPIASLLKNQIDYQSHECDVNAQSLAWQGRHFDILLTLLQANLPFPKSIDKNECSEELKTFIETCEEVQKVIKERNRQRLDEILSQNPNVKYFYSLSNESALKTALKFKRYKIYELLISKKFWFAPHEDTDELWNKLTPENKSRLHDIHFRHEREIPEKHINILMMNSSLAHDETDPEGKMKYILHAYKALNEDDRHKIILKTVAATKVFHIFFDFQEPSTFRIDPHSCPQTQGKFYFSGRVVIGALQLLDPEKEDETLGVLIHELCHYAMLAAFENSSRPYKSNDREAEEKFERILEICEEEKEEETIIDLVYIYPKEEQHAELIVRPAHIIAVYRKNPEKLKNVREIFPEIFDYFDNLILEVEKALPEIEERLIYKPTYVYEKLSEQNQFKVQNGIVSYRNIRVSFCELYPIGSNAYALLTSDHISNLLDGNILNLDSAKLHYLNKIVVLNWESLADSLRENFLDRDLNFQGQTVKFRDLQGKVSFESFKSLTSEQIIDVLSGREMGIGNKVESEVGFYVERKFIHEYAKMIRFEYQYGHDYEYDFYTEAKHKENRFASKSFEEFTDEFLKQSFEMQSQIFDKIKENLIFKCAFFDLHQRGYHFLYKDSKDIIQHAEKEKILILSSEAGAGKTVTFEKLTIEIKEACPTHWVSYIDLKDHVKKFQSKNTQKLLEDILELSAEKNEFERKIFEEYFKNGNVVLLWNGFDEISPTYNEVVLDFMKSIYKETKNIQFICTRTLYSEQLGNAFCNRTFQLIPFDEENKKEFLRKYFVFQSVASEDIEKNIQRVEEIIEKLKFKTYDPIYCINTPLMLKLISEIHENLLDSANVYQIYNIFVEKKVRDLLSRSTLGQDAIAKIIANSRVSMPEIFQKYSLLNEFHIFAITTLGIKIGRLQIMQKKIPKELPSEEITRMGILYINSAYKFEFVHKTFSEFFFAQYLIDNIYNAYDEVTLTDSEAELRLELFFQLTQNYGTDQTIITDFMTSYLKSTKESESKKFHPKISKLLTTKFKNFFIRMLNANYLNLEFLFEFFKKDHDLLINLLHIHEDETFYTAIFNPNHFALFTDPSEVLKLSQRYLSESELKKFTKGNNQKGKILFGMHMYKFLDIKKSYQNFETYSGTSFWAFFDEIKDILTENEHKELLVAALSPKIYLHYSKIFSSSDLFEYEKLWTVLEHLLTRNEIQDVLGNILMQYNEIFSKDKPESEKFLNCILKMAEHFLSDSEIYEIIQDKNILHESHYDKRSFNTLWNFLKNHSNMEQRRKILLQNDLDDKNYYFYYLFIERKENYSDHKYRYVYYDFTPFKIFHRSLITPDSETFEVTKEIYEEHFGKAEIQDIIMSSNDFLYYTIGKLSEERCKQLATYLKELFKGSEKSWEEYLEQKIESTNLSTSQLVEIFRGNPHSEVCWFNNKNILFDIFAATTSRGD